MDPKLFHGILVMAYTNLGGIHGEQSGQLAIIARYNDTLFVEMACVVESRQQLRFWLAGVSTACVCNCLYIDFKMKLSHA